MADDFSDEYIAGLLAKDAKESSIKYSAMGLEAFAPSKYALTALCWENTKLTVFRPANKPKPNTRFLTNIIKATDNHNAALLAKEAAESRARLQSLAGNGHRLEKSSQVGGGAIRKRQLGQIAAILGGDGDARASKRKRMEDDEARRAVRASRPRRANTSSDEESPRAKRRRGIPGEYRQRSADNQPPEKNDRRERGRRRISPSRNVEGQEGKWRKGSRSSSPRQHRDKDYRSRHELPSRKRSRTRSIERYRIKGASQRKRSRSPRIICTRDGKRAVKKPGKGSDHASDSSEEHFTIKGASRRKHLESPRRKSPRNDEQAVKKPAPKSNPDYDSDPLDDIIGPRPPPVEQVRTRGRGTISQDSGIDSRFSKGYDPKIDVQLDDEEENDWDQALEALRDRQKWKQQGADRLRAAGFTEAEVRKWENGGEKKEDDVRWAKKGEGREWDRGKTFDDNGGVKIDPEFGRLT